MSVMNTTNKSAPAKALEAYSAAKSGAEATMDPGKARRGVFWALANNSGRQLIAFTTFLGLARLLTPEDFGVVALASVLMLLGNVLVEQGLGEAVVQVQNLEPRHLDSVFWTTLAIGLGLTLVYWLMAPLIATLLRQPQLAVLLPILALQFPLNALALVPQSLLQRELNFRPLATRGLVALGFGCTLAIAFAFAGFGAWSLVAQQVGAAFAGTLVLWLSGDWRPRWHYCGRSLRELHQFGRKLVQVGLLDLFNRKFDDVLVGTVLGAAALGFYSVAYQALLILEQLISKGFDTLALSSLSRLQGDPAALAQALRTAIRYAAAVSVPLFLLAGHYAEPLIGLAFGATWLASAAVLQVLALVGVMHTIFHYNHAMFKAIGRPDLSARLAAQGALINFVGFLIAVPHGIQAVAWAYVIGGYLMTPLVLRHVKHLTGITVREYLGLLRPALLSGIGMFAQLSALAHFSPAAHTLPGMLLGSVLSVALYLLLIDRLDPALRRGLSRQAQPGLAPGHRPASGSAP